MSAPTRGIADLQKEFRTLRLLAWVLVILGSGLVLGGFGVALMTGSSKPEPTRAQRSAAEDIDRGNFAVRPSGPRTDEQKLMAFGNQLGSRTGMLGVVFLIIGGILIYILKNTLEDDQVEMSDELFKTYAAQLATAAKRKE